jgi:hypothetical protein
MNKRYAIIEDDIVVNIIAANQDPSFMTDLLCIEVDDFVEIGFIYNGKIFIKNNKIEQDEQTAI